MDVLSITGYNRRPPQLVAEYKGFFAKENLEVRFHETTYAPDHNQGMAEGKWDFTLSSADTMIARTTTDGVDYMLFMQAEEGLSAYLIGQPGFDSIDKLRGKLLAGDPGDSNLDLIRKKILRTHGIDDSEYDIEIIGSSPVRLEAFLQRRVVAAMLTPPASDKALGRRWGTARQRRRLCAGLAAYLRVDVAAVVVGSSRASRALHSRLGGGDGLVVASRRIARRPCSCRWTRKNLIGRLPKSPIPKSFRKARINPAALQTVIELRKEMGVYKPPFDPPARFYDESYWREATAAR